VKREATPSPLGQTLARALAGLRAALHDPFAAICVLVPAGPNSVLARRTLAGQGAQLRVWFETPEGLLHEQVPARFWSGELGGETPGWRRATVAAAVARLGAAGALGRFAEVLGRPGWRQPLASALERLEGHTLSAACLAALAADASCPEHLRERAGILAALLGALDEARATDRIAAPGALAAAATAAIGGREGVGASLARGAVVLGDRELPLTLFSFLERWLAAPDREVVRIVPPGMGGLPLAPLGLAAAAGRCEVLEVPVQADLPEELGALLARLFRGESGSPAPDDGSVALARTPDDVRECVECVREVQRAIAGGVALDRIAIVLPDARQATALEEALERAELPCTFLVGRPASGLPAARLLRVVLALACGDATPARLYELLTHPALGLRGALGPDAIKGKGRWRRLLGKLALARGLDRIAAGIERLELSEALDGEDRERELAARASLVGAIRAVEEALGPLLERGPLGAHARAWGAFLQRFARRSEPRGRLLALLEPIAAASSGPELGALEARDELDALLEREVVRGNLAERSIRVLPPMSLVGGEHDVVCLLGLTEGRFPAAAHEDAILPDELLALLGARLSRALPLSREHEALERRRLAAAAGAARRRLWLSVPVLDFETERPALPSSLALEVLSALLGRRARYGDLEARVASSGGGAGPAVLRAGSRARSYPPDPEDAVGGLEHLVARLAATARLAEHARAGGKARALAALASHLVSRGVLRLHRSMFRAQSGELDAWSGLVRPDLLPAPGLDGEPISLAALCTLLEAPGEFFFRHMLRAWGPPSLRPWQPPLERRALEEQLAAVASETTAPAGEVERALVGGVLEGLEAARELGAFDQPALDQARPMVETIGRELAANEDAHGFCRRPACEGALVVAEGLPWRIVPRGRLVGEGDDAVLVDVAASVGKKRLGDRPDLVLSGLALAAAGSPPEKLKVVAASGSEGNAPFVQQVDAVLEALTEATTRARAGRFPVGDSWRFGLVGDRPGASAPEEGEEGGEP